MKMFALYRQIPPEYIYFAQIKRKIGVYYGFFILTLLNGVKKGHN